MSVLGAHQPAIQNHVSDFLFLNHLRTMNDQINAIFDWLLQIRTGICGVYHGDQIRSTLAKFTKLLKVEDRIQRIAWCLPVKYLVTIADYTVDNSTYNTCS